VPDRHTETRGTYPSGPFLSIRAGGPFDGVVTITAIADGRGRLLVQAQWTRKNEKQSTSRIADDHDDAQSLAQQWADLLAAGNEPPWD
jgi:hypothetical protein